ncbi:uncharacterized protein K460DRAFT_409292 [Cucurbitaria berberidis CBS 394.84]|uniref:Uncharacterized protein n=1 Tax=Cucurbitaria berberidis CBS 394.84 TaxID=1168544 RepID=A0A9P4L4C2_9PLEO|nr:uncharacterized protein K460DRAFT_409292 [Cucurbitaria berberidis CBS 394.84]KAF1841851.1 hypothetical protein K460DRAFT_409292 [Cucurbitaria berberidis CBS 394.84]
MYIIPSPALNNISLLFTKPDSPHQLESLKTTSTYKPTPSKTRINLYLLPMARNLRSNAVGKAKLGTKQKRDSARNGNLVREQDEQKAIAEAISRSLADAASTASTAYPRTLTSEEQYDSDLAKGKYKSLTAKDEPAVKSSSNNRISSYFGFEATIPSSSTKPHAPLYHILEELDEVATALEKSARELREVDPAEVANCVRDWGSKVFEINYALEVCETQRIKDIQRHLDLDQETEEKHQRDLEHLNKAWEAKMMAKEEEMAKKMEELRRMYETRLAGHTIEMPSSPESG